MEILSSEFPRTEGVTGESPAKGHYNVKGTASSFQWKNLQPGEEKAQRDLIM